MSFKSALFSSRQASLGRLTPLKPAVGRHIVSKATNTNNSGPPAPHYTPYPDPFPDYQPGEDLPPGYDHVDSSPPRHRRAGIILHPTSLPGKYGIGEIGTEALRFIDWLEEAGMQLWQMLPLVPPETSYWSPYTGLDALCGNTLLIPLDELADMGLLKHSELPETVPETSNADFPTVFDTKSPLLDIAAQRLLTDPAFSSLKAEMSKFRADNPWLEQSALFSALTEQPDLVDTPWWTWPEEIRFRDPATLAALTTKHAQRINIFIALQFLFDHFWQKVKVYANERGVGIVGDMPIYVGGQSADVWAHRELFELTADGSPALVSGVPPDAFSSTGQLWGSPLYDWQAQRKDGYAWWVQRFKRSFQLYDEIRVDHFRAFAGYWAVEATQETAMIGTWKKGPGKEIFDALESSLDSVTILAEDLGVITADVVALRKAIDAPGMMVLQFAWGGGSTNTHLPHNAYENSFMYPGTHDNQTSVGWWQTSARPEERTLIRNYFGVQGDDVAWWFITAALNSISRTAVMSMQDVMRLDDTARMNTPGKAAGNWSWRVGGSDVWKQLNQEATELRRLVEATDRLSPIQKNRRNMVGSGRQGLVSFH